MKKEFIAGDVVMLNSSGPAMTIERIVDNIAWCSWFGSGDTLQKHNFSVCSLKYVAQSKNSSDE